MVMIATAIPAQIRSCRMRPFIGANRNAKIRPAGVLPEGHHGTKLDEGGMRRFGVALVCALGMLATSARSQEFPSGTVRLLVPFAAGGPTDVVARILADLLSARWGGKPVVVENRPGRRDHRDDHGGRQGAPDGHTLGVATNSLLINPAIGMKLPYDTFREIAGVTMIATQPVALVANKSFPANSLAEVVELARKAAGAAQLHLARAARRRASRRRTLAAEGRTAHDPHQLQWQRAGADRCHRRAGAADVRHLAFGAALCGFQAN